MTVSLHTCTGPPVTVQSVPTVTGTFHSIRNSTTPLLTASICTSTSYNKQMMNSDDYVMVTRVSTNAIIYCMLVNKFDHLRVPDCTTQVFPSACS